MCDYSQLREPQPVLSYGRGAEGHGHLDGERRPSNFDDTPFKYEIAGFTVETTCCVNKKAYKHDVDIPCNAAARRGSARCRARRGVVG